MNNIYDMAGNEYEWTLEGSTSYRFIRGGFGGSSVGSGSIHDRMSAVPNRVNAHSSYYGCRLYMSIK